MLRLGPTILRVSVEVFGFNDLAISAWVSSTKLEVNTSFDVQHPKA